MNYIAQCLEKFRQLPEGIKNKIGGFEVLLIIKKLEEKYGVPLNFLIILVSIGEVSMDGISEYLEKKYAFSEEDAFELRGELVRDIFSLLLFDAEPAAISQVTLKERFSKEIKELLTNVIEAEKINYSIFSIFSKDGLFQDKLSKIFIDNQEELFTGKLVIEDREVSPTVANWLKDFVKVNGSNIFDELTLAQYLTNSANVKKLKSEEKDLLRKLLKLYRNLAFFPESMENIPIEDWQIIPVSKEEIALHQSKNKKELVESRDVLSDKKEEITAKAEVVTEEAKPIDELENILTSYKPGTLEHKAVTQEIGRLNKKSKK